MTPGPSHRRPAARDANGWCSPHPKSGNVRQLAGVTGTVTASYAYDSFGGLRQSADNDSTYKNEFQLEAIGWMCSKAPGLRPLSKAERSSWSGEPCDGASARSGPWPVPATLRFGRAGPKMRP